MVDANFKEAVRNNRIEDIRDFLRMRLTLDHNYVSGMFVECRDYCFSHGIRESYLYEKFDGRELPSADTEDNFTKILGHLSTNFAKERVNRLLEIGKTIWPEEQTKFEKKETRVFDSEAGKSSERRTISEKIVQNDKEDKTGHSGRRVISERPILNSNGKDDDGKKDDKTGSYEQQGHRANTDSKSSNTVVVVAAAAIVVAGVIIVAALLG